MPKKKREALTRWPFKPGAISELDAAVGQVVSPYGELTKHAVSGQKPKEPKRPGLPPPFCYPGALLDPAVTRNAEKLMAMQLNNIGTHTRGISESGFETVQEMERDVIHMVANVLGGTTDGVDGFFCGGATEANLQGIWIGREWLQHRSDPLGRGIVVLVTPLFHYSINKAAEMLNLGHPQWLRCPRCHKDHSFVPDQTGSGVNMVGMNERGEMSVEDLERVFRLRYEEGFRRFMVVPTAGTTTFGSVDPISEIDAFVDRVHRETSASVYMHVDAAFGGFTIPFVNPDLPIAFQNSNVMSVSVDADKMGQMPYPAGMFLARKGLQSLVARKVNYVRGSQDDTVPGSRTGVTPVLAWRYYQEIGFEGQRDYVQKCLDARNRLKRLIQGSFDTEVHSPFPTVRILSVPEWTNFLPIEIDIGDRPKEDLAAFAQRYHLRSDNFPSNPRDVLSCPRTVYKICVMPHLFEPFDWIPTFVEDLVKLIND